MLCPKCHKSMQQTQYLGATDPKTKEVETTRWYTCFNCDHWETVVTPNKIQASEAKMDDRLITRSEVYLQRGAKYDGDKSKEVRHIINLDDFHKICADLGIDEHNKVGLNEEDLPPIGKPILEWPEKK